MLLLLLLLLLLLFHRNKNQYTDNQIEPEYW